MNYDIKELLDLKDCEDILIKNIKIDNDIKTITLEKILKPIYCPMCNERMYSQGFYTRSVDHSILNDGYKLKLKLRQRKYRCTNKNCNYYMNEEFSFVEKYKQKSYITPYLILEDLKDISTSIAYVARKRKVSDTYVHNIVLTHLNFKRLELNEVLSIDEVFLDINNEAKYCVVLRDFISDQIIDILPNRFKGTFDEYFLHIPKEERDKVKYVLCDMYKPYINLTNTYFIKAGYVIDSFHIIQWINNRINLYINEVKKKYQKYDDERRKELNYLENKDFIKRKDSKEVYLLKNHKWVLLANENNISYVPYRRLNRRLGEYVNTKDIVDKFLALDNDFLKIKILKEKYIEFNNSIDENEEELNNKLNNLINEYKNSDYQMFKDFGALLDNNKEGILNSFTRFKVKSKTDNTIEFYKRLSNGPMEGFNRTPKDMKRQARGFTNFDFVRNRILWSTRQDASFLGSPIPLNEIKEKHKSPKRGPYKKNK